MPQPEAEKINAENIILFGVKASPYVRKVMVALKEKQLSFEQKETFPKVLLEKMNQVVPRDFDRASPLGKIPALQVGDFCISDSAVIAQYLDAKFPTTLSLYPAQPEHRGNALWFEKYADTALTEVVYKKLFIQCVIKPVILKKQPNTEVVEAAISEELPPLLDYLEQSICDKSWFAGDAFSMADIAITTQLLALKMAQVELNSEQWPQLSSYFNKIMSRSSFSEFA